MNMLHWIAKFRDGEEMREQDGTHSEYDSPYHSLACLDRPVRSLGWFDGDRLVAGVLLPAGVKPYLLRRNGIDLATGLHTIELYIAGWECEFAREYVAIYPDGSVLTAPMLEELEHAG